MQKSTDFSMFVWYKQINPAGMTGLWHLERLLINQTPQG
jgi:hypothetical protein